MNRSWLWLLSALLLVGCGPLRVQRYLACFERELLLAHPEAQPGGDRRLLLELVHPTFRTAVDHSVRHYRSYRISIGGEPFVLHLLQAEDRYQASRMGNLVQKQRAAPAVMAGFPAYVEFGEPAVYGILAHEGQGDWPDTQRALKQLLAEGMGDCKQQPAAAYIIRQEDTE